MPKKNPTTETVSDLKGIEDGRTIKYWKMEALCCLGWQRLRRSEIEKLPGKVKYLKLTSVSFCARFINSGAKLC